MFISFLTVFLLVNQLSPTWPIIIVRPFIQIWGVIWSWWSSIFLYFYFIFWCWFLPLFYLCLSLSLYPFFCKSICILSNHVLFHLFYLSIIIIFYLSIFFFYIIFISSIVYLYSLSSFIFFYLSWLSNKLPKKAGKTKDP